MASPLAEPAAAASASSADADAACGLGSLRGEPSGFLEAALAGFAARCRVAPREPARLRAECEVTGLDARLDARLDVEAGPSPLLLELDALGARLMRRSLAARRRRTGDSRAAGLGSHSGRESAESVARPAAALRASAASATRSGSAEPSALTGPAGLAFGTRRALPSRPASWLAPSGTRDGPPLWARGFDSPDAPKELDESRRSALPRGRRAGESASAVCPSLMRAATLLAGIEDRLSPGSRRTRRGPDCIASGPTASWR